MAKNALIVEYNQIDAEPTNANLGIRPPVAFRAIKNPQNPLIRAAII